MIAEVGALLPVVEEVAEGAAADPPRLLAPADPDAHLEPVARLGDRRQEVRVLLAAAQQVVGGDQPLGGAGEAAVALEAGLDEAVIGHVVAAEQRRDPLVERGLGERARGREQAEDGPLDAVGERHRGRREVVAVGQPPAAGFDLDEAALGRTAELVADEADQAVDGIGSGSSRSAPRRARARGRSAVVGGLGVGGRRLVARIRFVRAAAVAGAATPPSDRASSRAAVASRRSCPARSRPTRISPRSRSKRAGSPRSRSVSTATSVTVRAASVAENGRSSNRSGAPNRRVEGTMSGSPAPPGSGSRPTFARVRAPGGRRAPGGSSSTIAAASSSASDSRALTSR